MRDAESRFAGPAQNTDCSRCFRGGSWAQRSDSLSAAGSGASAYRAALAVGCLSVVALIAMVGPTSDAHAAFVHVFGSSFNSGGSLTEPGAVAVDESTNDVYVRNGDTIQKFDENGNPANFSALGSNTLALPCGFPGTTTGCDQISVDNSGGPNQGVIYVGRREVNQSSTSQIHVFLPSGEVADSINNFSQGFSGCYCDAVVDGSGRVYVLHDRGDLITSGALGGSTRAYIDRITPPTWQANTSFGVAPETTLFGLNRYAGRLAINSAGSTIYATNGPDATHGIGGAFSSQRFASGPLDLFSDGLFGVEPPPATPFTTIEGKSKNVDVDQISGHVYSVRSPAAENPATGTEVAKFAAGGGELEAFGEGEIVNATDIAVNGGTGKAYVADEGAEHVSTWIPTTVPDTTTGAASSVTRVAATLAGHVDPIGAGEIIDCHFEYVTTVAFSESGFATAEEEPCVPAAPFNTDQNVTAELSGLEVETLYHYRVTATNANGKGNAQPLTFKTQGAVFGLTTDPATNVAPRSATLNASYEGDGDETKYRFEWGLSDEYGEETAEEVDTTVGPQALSAELSGLELETTYHYRVVAENSLGTTFGDDETFTTLPAVANLVTEPPTNVARNSATLNASYEGDGDETTYFFEWRKDGTSYEDVTTTKNAGSPVGPTGLTDELAGLEVETTYYYRVVAENSLGITVANEQLFATLPAVKDLTTGAATNIASTEATLHGTLDPDGLSTTYYFEWGKDTGYGQATPLPPGVPVGTPEPGVTPVSTVLEDLEPGTTYHYRIAAANSSGITFGMDEEFTTPQAPSINSFSSTNVTATSADLTATINPNGANTTYYFEYGPSVTYGSIAPLPLPGGELPAGETVESVVVPIADLDGVTYHFRLTAENEWGTTQSEDQTFDFNPPRVCPNNTLRQQTGAGYVPDCRAYELVSAANAAGAALLPEGAVAPDADGRFSYQGLLNAIPGTGEPQNAGLFKGDMYVATRTTAGWISKYVGIPGSQSIEQLTPPGEEYGFNWPGTPTDRSMNRLLVWDGAQGHILLGGSKLGTYAPHVFDNSGNDLGRLPTNVEDVPGALADISEGGYEGSVALTPDFGHYVFSSIKVPFAPGGLAQEPGSAYDNDIDAETVTVISRTEGGADIPKDPAVGSDYIRIPAVSNDGSHILMSTRAPGNTVHLYMRVNNAISYDISDGQSAVNQGVKFEGMTSDGSSVYFTTNKQMSADDTDTSIDLYMWSEATQALARVSDSGNLPGDTDACSAGWTSKCNVEVVPVSPVEFKKFDSAMAREAGDVYFYSPEQLDGARGVPGGRNLFVYRDGSVQHVATLANSAAATRINVSAAGAYMALISSSQLTPYDNAGFRQMYRYDADARHVMCVSCRPDGEAPTAHVEGSQNGLFMTNDGRAFFGTTDSLIPKDANGTIDVYEFIGGRPQLISSGTGDDRGNEFQPAGLVGVSSDGVDVFFGTYDTLVQQDENGAVLKFYTARTNGGIPAAQLETPCVAADECHGPDSDAPAPLQIGTGAYLGVGGDIRRDTCAGYARRAKRFSSRAKSLARRASRSSGKSARRARRRARKFAIRARKMSRRANRCRAKRAGSSSRRAER